MKKNIVTTLLTAAAVLALAGCTQSAPETTTTTAVADATASNSTDTFTVGFDQNFPPMGFVDENGEYTGFDLEIAKEVATRLGRTFVAQPIAWESKDMELTSGTVDCIWNGFTINGREDSYTWSEPYMENRQVFVVKSDYDITKVEDLAGKIVMVQVDSSAEAALKDNTELTSTFSSLETTPDYNTAFLELEMGSVDAVAMDEIVAAYQISQRDGGYMILEEEIASEAYGIGFKKGNTELRDQVQTTLEEMAADGSLTEISEKWFSRDVTTVGK